MTEPTTRDLMIPRIRDLYEKTAAGHGDHDRVARRAGDVERTATCEALAEHFVAGRLSLDELENRLGWAVRAVTEDELRRLTADLPLPSTRSPNPPPRPTRPEAHSATWPAIVVLAVIALIVSVLIAGGMLLVLGAVNPLLFIGACLGGSAAFVAGCSAAYLVTRRRHP